MTRKIKISLISLTLVLSGIRAFGQGVILWDESVNGELSQDYTRPTSLTPVLAGSNSVIGATEIIPYGNNWGGYPDDFLLTVPTNMVVTAVYLTVNRPNVWAWIGDASYVNQLGWVRNPSSGDLLSQWGISALPPGTYGMYMQNDDAQSVPSIANYRLDFVAQPAPEPTGAVLLLFGFGLFVVCRSRLLRKPQ
jgi:hypothetical protein